MLELENVGLTLSGREILRNVNLTVPREILQKWSKCFKKYYLKY